MTTFKEVLKLSESLKSRAWMIRNDGEVFPVVQHPYGEQEVPEEALAAGEWLYTHTNKDDVKSLVIEMISRWIRYTEKKDNGEDIIEAILSEIESRPYKFLSKEFVKDHEKEIRVADVVSGVYGKNPKAYYAAITNELNQEFMRARFGGMYNTNSSSSEMVFRISSTGKNWYNIIWQFVYDNKNQIKTVTIVRDEEATGVVDGFYKTHDGKAFYNQMPVDDFINESGNPVIESKEQRNLSLDSSKFDNVLTKKIIEELATGCSINSLYSLKGNRERIWDKYLMLKYKENSLVSPKRLPYIS